MGQRLERGTEDGAQREGTDQQSPPAQQSQPKCVNLKERYGRQYKVRYEESYYAEHGTDARVDDPWLQIIPGARGHVFPWSTATLAATTNGSGRTAKTLKALPFVEVYTDASDGVTLLFPVDRLGEIANLLKLRRWRQVNLTEEQRVVIGKRLANARNAAQQTMAGARSEARPCVPMPLSDLEHQTGESPSICPSETA